MAFSSLMGLLFCNVMWSAAYSVGKSLMQNFRPLEISFLRTCTALIPLLIYCAWGGRRSLLARWARDIGLVDFRVFAVGFITFFLSPLCQMTGLSKSRAIDGSLIVTLEPVFTVFAALVVLRERMRLSQAMALGFGMIGVGILSDLTWDKLADFSDARLVGNAVFVLSLVSEAGYSVLSKPALDRRSPVLLVTLGLVVGAVSLFLFNIASDGTERLSGLVPLFSARRWTDCAAILYLGLGCTAFGYLFWLVVLQNAPVSAMVLTLYIQPVLGIALGHFWLGEPLSSSTMLGSLLIFVAVWLGSRPIARERSKISSREVTAP